MSYIDRDEAITALRKALFDYEDKTEKQFLESDELDIYDWVEHRIFVQNMNDIDCKTILEMPEADVEPVRHGRWIEVDESENTYECSVCNEPWTLIEGTPLDNEMLRCPKCGAKMDEEENKDDE